MLIILLNLTFGIFYYFLLFKHFIFFLYLFLNWFLIVIFLLILLCLLFTYYCFCLRKYRLNVIVIVMWGFFSFFLFKSLLEDNFNFLSLFISSFLLIIPPGILRWGLRYLRLLLRHHISLVFWIIMLLLRWGHRRLIPLLILNWLQIILRTIFLRIQLGNLLAKLS